MNNGYVKVAAATPKIVIGDCGHNKLEIAKMTEEAYKNGAQLIVFPELCITGYTASDLFWQKNMLDLAFEKINELAKDTKDMEIVSVVGAPIRHKNKLYNCGVVIYAGEIKGIVPKSFIPSYSEFYEGRHFTSGEGIKKGETRGEIPFGTNLIFDCGNIENFTFAIEICEDLWVPNPPSTNHALAGANVILNLSASDEITGKADYRRKLVEMQSAKNICAYIYSDAGDGESSTDLVFAGHNIIAENGTMVAQSKRFESSNITYGDIDLDKIATERQRMTTFYVNPDNEDYMNVSVRLKNKEVKVDRYIDKAPFVPSDTNKRNARCEEILEIQTWGLRRRLEHTGCSNAVIGISGGLDSTLALLVTVKAFDALGLDRKGIHAVTMPGFGTTDRTYLNAVELIKELGCDFKEINISEAVTLHLAQIEHDIENHDVTYENAQARQRTYLLMDLANKYNGMVIGTGDMSELALGWATYNGDHMSMYGVNAGVPKTLVRHLVKYYADVNEGKISNILYDILDTPVSPELLPPKDGVIAQKTEELVGPYELHDFFLYYMLRFGYTPKKIQFLAELAFDGEYDTETIKKWLKTFYRRFFSQQFKRSCLPDGPKVGTVAVSPRGDLRMPSDASVKEWLDEIK